MITGVVSRDREAIVRLRVRGPQGVELEIDTVLDTGFTEYLTLPQSSVAGLSLSWLFTEDVTLADGGLVPVGVFECVVDWDGQQRSCGVHCLEGSPLLGM